MSCPTPFDVLGVTPEDDAWTIRHAWRRLVKAHHPDRNPGNRTAARGRLEAVNAAYDAIGGVAPDRDPEPARANTQKCRRPEACAKLPVLRQRDGDVETDQPRDAPARANEETRTAMIGFREAAVLIARPLQRRSRLA